MEDAGRSDGRSDHKRRAGDASSQRLQPGLQTGFVEGNLSLWQRLHTARDQISSAEGQGGR